MKYTTHSAQDTQNIAIKLAKSLDTPTILLLHGDLGTGKTTFAQGFAQGLGISEEITSPTFLIAQQYPITHKDIHTFVHIDAYKVTDPMMLEVNGVFEALDSGQTIALVEWAEHVPILKEKYPDQIIEVFLSLGNEDTTRTIQIQSHK
jgi:tRNA threonylcarbamoyladenosine biosynthesis protein TsaE